MSRPLPKLQPPSERNPASVVFIFTMSFMLKSAVAILLLAIAVIAAPGTGPPRNPPSQGLFQRTIGTGCVTFTLDPPGGSVLSLTPTIKITFDFPVEFGY